MLGHRGIGRVGSAAADAEYADPVLVDVVQGHQIVDRAAEILHTGGRILQVARLAAALALIARVESQGHVTQLGETFGVDAARGLFLAAADRMSTDDRGVFLCRIEVAREADIGCYLVVPILENEGIPYYVLLVLVGSVNTRWRSCGTPASNDAEK